MTRTRTSLQQGAAGTALTLKNRILLENYYLPGDLEAQVDAFVEHYNHHRYHVYFGRAAGILP